MEKQANKLIHSSSPYLLQHAYNPVEWYEWGPEALEKARNENKLILVSIGYSACHWCHVMERESFENFEVAEAMNRNYVCIKVDREERPDIDQIYMYAIQLMTGAGGWPLNCICLPDQRPIYGGTYFRKTDWINILDNVAALWANEPDKAVKYAERLTAGIKDSELVSFASQEADFHISHLHEIVEPWKRHFDITFGGYSRSPKFPLPNNWLFLYRYAYLSNDDAVLMATHQSLLQMARGGIYDQIGGGFARYSVDDKWHVPHFEKMLYDNVQLIELYAEAYQHSKNDEYKQVVEETIEWLRTEMTAPNGLFYSALDADSEGVEGKYYTWDLNEIKQLLGAESSFIADYFNITEGGNWEEEEINIARRLKSDEEFLKNYNLTILELNERVKSAKRILYAAREKRIKPGLDDKCLTSWNAMMVKALLKAASVFENKDYYHQAISTLTFLLDNLKSSNGGLYRNYKNDKASIAGFLDDYAFLIDALITAYESDFNENWLLNARNFSDFVLNNFKDEQSPMLFYTDDNSAELIARKHEVMDNVIASANSVMAQNFQKLALFFDDENFEKLATQMLNAVLPKIKAYGSAYSNWCIQLLNEVYGINEIALAGNDIQNAMVELHNFYIPNKITLGGTKSSLPLLKGKESFETKVYICRNKVCQLPVSSVEEALKYLQ